MSDAPWTPDWEKDWDAEVGLWSRPGPGHTVPVRGLARLHTGQDGAQRLLQAAQVGQLDRLPVAQVLRALREMQVTEPGDHEGCFRWYWEETEPVDTNAAFFITLNLLPLHLCFRDQLGAETKELLDALLAGALTWFLQAVEERTFYYPNKFLGDLSCAWLLLEVADTPDPDGLVERTMLEAASYWEANGWGWGEHLSDGYSVVCLQELSLLLLFAQRLPEPVREEYAKLLAALLEIEDAFADGPRVPALRSYAFADSPRHVNYRDRVRPLSSGEAPALEHLFAVHGWHELAPARQESRRDTDFLCFGGARAVGRCEPDVRLGSVSRYPLLPTAEHATWGLCWQSFPVCFWRPAGDWGFLQWAVQAGDRLGCHPSAGSFYTSYGNAALALGVEPPLFGQTWALQRGGNVLVLRVLPATMPSWEYAADRLRLLGCTGELEEDRSEGDLRLLHLLYPERTLGVACLPLTEGAEVLLQGANEEPRDWEFRWNREVLGEGLALLWGLSLDGPIEASPVLLPDREALVIPRSPAQRAWTLTWTWPGEEWRLRIDPLAEEPLRPV